MFTRFIKYIIKYIIVQRSWNCTVQLIQNYSFAVDVMKALVPLLLCLLPVLVEADSHIVPYLTFMGNNIPNHSYVDLNTVGSALNGLDSVQCHTDLKTCCNRPQDRDRGSWYFPSGKRLNFFGGGVVYENRTDERIDLRYLREGGASGMYRCDIETTSVNERAGWETAYVGLYNRGGEFSYLVII